MTLGGTSRVYVDRNQGFCRVDDNTSARRQFYRVLKCSLNLAFNLVSTEQGNGIAVRLELGGIVRHDLSYKGGSFRVRCFALNQYLADISSEVIPDGSQYSAVFLVKQGRVRLFLFSGLNGLPNLQQVVQIPVQFLGTAANAGCSHDDAHTLRYFHLRHRCPQLISFFAFNASRDAPCTRVVRHENHVSTG